MNRRKLIKLLSSLPLLAVPGFAFKNSDSELEDIIYLYRRYCHYLKNYAKHNFNKSIPILWCKEWLRLETAVNHYEEANSKLICLDYKKKKPYDEDLFSYDIQINSFMYCGIPFCKKEFIKLINDYFDIVKKNYDKRPDPTLLVLFDEDNTIYITREELQI